MADGQAPVEILRSESHERSSCLPGRHVFFTFKNSNGTAVKLSQVGWLRVIKQKLSQGLSSEWILAPNY